MATDPQEQAKEHVRAYAQEHLDKSDPETTFDVYVVWFAYTLGNWKALLSTTLRDGMYYEVTHRDGGLLRDSETYLDAYKKFENKLVQS